MSSDEPLSAIQEVEMKKMLLVIALCLLSASTLPAQNLSGPISGNLGPGTYTVVGDILVAANSTLTVAPGTTFLHNGHWTWTIAGNLIANGTLLDSIKWIRRQEIPEDRWGGLRFQSSSTAPNLLYYCVIDNCVQTTSAMNGGGLYVLGASLQLRHSRISNCGTIGGYGGGIMAQGTSLLADHCMIVNNTATTGGSGGGINLESCTATTISNSEISYNSGGGT
jgi:hypothetical protein